MAKPLAPQPTRTDRGTPARVPDHNSDSVSRGAPDHRYCAAHPLAGRTGASHNVRPERPRGFFPRRSATRTKGLGTCAPTPTPAIPTARLSQLRPGRSGHVCPRAKPIGRFACAGQLIVTTSGVTCPASFGDVHGDRRAHLYRTKKSIPSATTGPFSSTLSSGGWRSYAWRMARRRVKGPIVAR
jgi:hypothetical protein